MLLFFIISVFDLVFVLELSAIMQMIQYNHSMSAQQSINSTGEEAHTTGSGNGWYKLLGLFQFDSIIFSKQ